MRVDGREIAVAGNLLQPLTRRTNDIVRVGLSGVFLALVVTSSLITRSDWVGLEKSISRIVGVLSPTQSNLVYLAYGIAIVALPFVIFIGLIAGRQWKLLGAYAAAGFIAVLSLSITGQGITAPDWHFDLNERLSTTLSQFLDDPRWIAMLAAVLTVSGPWLPARWRRWWWALLLAFVPIHLVVSAVVPARSLLGLSVGWFVGALVVLVVGTPALEVPLDGAVRALSRRGFHVEGITVVRPAGRGPLELLATGTAGEGAVIELYGPNQRSGGAIRQFWRWLVLRDSETGPLQTSMHRAVEHRALMTIAVGDLEAANTTTLDPGRPGPRLDHVRPYPAAGDAAGSGRAGGGRPGVERAGSAAPPSDRARRPARQPRSPSTTGMRCSAGSATPSTARRRSVCRPTSPSCC
jgi:hypothetical protein